MAVPFNVSTTPSDQIEVQWRRTFFKEYVRNSGFKPYMGAKEKGMMMPISVMMDNKKGGQTTRIPLLTKLRNRGTVANGTLVGREEQVGKYSFNAKIEWHRHAVATNERDEHYSFVKLANEMRPLLQQWCQEQVRDEIIDALAMVQSNLPGTPDYLFAPPLVTKDVAADVTLKAVASTTVLNQYATDNADRILYGYDRVVGSTAALNAVSGNFAASLANIDATEKFGAAMVMRMKYLARHSEPLIRPIRIGEKGNEYYVCFADSDCFDQAWSDTEIKNANKEARSREGNGIEKNPLFQDGDLLYKGVIIREIPEIIKIAKAQYTSSVDIGRVHLCGAQAVAFSWGMEPDFRNRKEDDYGMIKGVGVVEARGCQAIQFPVPTTLANPVGATRNVNFGRVDGFVGLT